MQYLVQTSGEILNRLTKAYVIDASSEEIAQEIAKETFSKDFCVESENIYVKPYSRTNKAIVSYALMAIPIFLSFINWKNGHATISISPDYISCLGALALYFSFVIRFKGIQRTISSWIDVLFCVFITLLFSSFIKTILISETLNFLGLEISVNTNHVVIFAILLSWLGMKLVSVLCMLFVGILAMSNITALSDAMGSVIGPLYLICSFLGLFFYLSVEPALLEIVPYFRNSVHKGINCAKNDVIQAGNSARNLTHKAMDYAKSHTIGSSDTNNKDSIE